jgi:cyclophilin family peptidyl-prolyl cis-trans isomerase
MPARRLLPLALLLLALVLAACGGSSSGTTKSAKATATQAPATTETPGATNSDTGCRSAKPSGAKKPKPSKPTAKLDPKKTYIATVATNCGTFQIKLDVKHAPKTAASFVSLAKQHFFDGLTFHRIVPGFVIQGGDPSGNGTGGPGYSVTEAPPKGVKYSHGVVAMAKSGSEPAGASGSQFFVVTAPDAGLPPDYALLGKVTKGLDVVDAIGVVPTSSDEQPVDPVVMSSVKVSAK